MQKFFTYKINIFNSHESPWEGTRAIKKKDLKGFNYLRKKVLSKNIKKNFLRFDLEKNIQIIQDGGWHFNNLYSLEKLSKKIQISPHQEFNKKEFYEKINIKEKITNLEDLYGKGYMYEKLELDNSYPVFILKNKSLFKDYIL